MSGGGRVQVYVNLGRITKWYFLFVFFFYRVHVIWPKLNSILRVYITNGSIDFWKVINLFVNFDLPFIKDKILSKPTDYLDNYKIAFNYSNGRKKYFDTVYDFEEDTVTLTLVPMNVHSESSNNMRLGHKFTVKLYFRIKQAIRE